MMSTNTTDQVQRLVAGAAQGSRGHDDRRTGARDTGRRSVLERDRPSPASSRSGSGGGGADGDRPQLALFSRRSAGGSRQYPQQGRPGACGYSRRSGGGCRHRPIRPSPCRRRRRYVPDRTLKATIESWRLEPTHPDWARGLRETWKPGSCRPRPGSRNFCKLMPQGIPPNATGRIAMARTCALARSARGRLGTPRALPRPSPPCACGRHRQVPRRTGLARILPASLVRRARYRDAQSAALFRRISVAA